MNDSNKVRPTPLAHTHLPSHLPPIPGFTLTRVWQVWLGTVLGTALKLRLNCCEHCVNTVWIASILSKQNPSKKNLNRGLRSTPGMRSTLVILEYTWYVCIYIHIYMLHVCVCANPASSSTFCSSSKRGSRFWSPYIYTYTYICRVCMYV